MGFLYFISEFVVYFPPASRVLFLFRFGVRAGTDGGEAAFIKDVPPLLRFQAQRLNGLPTVRGKSKKEQKSSATSLQYVEKVRLSMGEGRLVFYLF